jgi:hypothetical protein
MVYKEGYKLVHNIELGNSNMVIGTKTMYQSEGLEIPYCQLHCSKGIPIRSLQRVMI